MNHLKVMIILIVWLVMTNNVMAACSFVNGASVKEVSLFSRNITKYATDTSITTASVNQSPVGLASLFGVGQNENIVECTGDEYLIYGESNLTIQGDRLLTDVASFVLYVTSNSWSYPSAAGDYVKSISNRRVTPNDLGAGGGISFRYELGQVSQTTKLNGNYDRIMTVKTSDGLEIIRFYVGVININVPACSINTYDKQVRLGKVNKSALNTIGSTANATDFNISMTCGGIALKPYLTFEGETDSTYVDVFSNPVGATYARGVGVRLMYDKNIIIPGMSVALTPSSTAMQNYTFSANYVRVGALSSGAIEIPVTFTMTYE